MGRELETMGQEKNMCMSMIMFNSIQAQRRSAYIVILTTATRQLWLLGLHHD